MDVFACYGFSQSVSYPGKDLLGERVFPAGTPAADYIVILVFHLFKQPRNVFRIVLQVAIYADHDFAFCVVKSRFECCALSEVFSEFYQFDPVVFIAGIPHSFECFVGGTVVNGDDLEIAPYAFQNTDQFVTEESYVLFFVIDRDYD